MHGNLGVEEHAKRHQEGEERNMVHAQDAGAPMNHIIVCREVFGPEEGLLTEFDRCREEAEHCPEDWHLEEHRETASHHVHSGFPVQFHCLLLLLHRVLLLGILGVYFVDVRLQGLHLCR